MTTNIMEEIKIARRRPRVKELFGAPILLACPDEVVHFQS